MDPTEKHIPGITSIDLSSLQSLSSLDDLNNTVTITSGSTGISSGYSIGGSNAIWTTGTTVTPTFVTTPNVVPSFADLSAIGSPMTLNQGGKITLKGEQADIDINGKSMLQWMQKVEERLNILTPNSELEKDWDDLRKLGERYRKLEKKCKEKAEVWKKLKQMPPPKLD